MLTKMTKCCAGEEEAVPAKKIKTVISSSQISRTRQTRMEKVINIFTQSRDCCKHSVLLCEYPAFIQPTENGS